MDSLGRMSDEYMFDIVKHAHKLQIHLSLT